ncbi:hypothetical protein K7432_003635 [Basidiobolus ranarum]|uniref:Cytochrome P450 n=1 Tax=Basidiobolus ranarum TaxID=34480 RepID=A0ABR2WZG8_9FUNG
MIGILISAVILMYLLKLFYHVSYSRKYLPPGPLGLPLVGNFFQLGRLPHLTLTKWARKYGPVFSIRLGVRLCVVVNDTKSVKEIFVKRGSKYSSRNQSYLINEVCFRADKGVSVLPYGNQWRKMRKAIYRAFNSSAVQSYLPVLDLQTNNLLLDLVEASDKSADDGFYPEDIMKKFSFNSVVALLVGRSLRPSEEYIMKEFVQATDDLHGINNVGASFLSYFPFLNKFPNNPIFKKGYDIREKREQIVREIQNIGALNGHLESPNRPETVLETIQKHAEKDGLDDMDIIYLCDSLLRGGFDSSACFLTWATLILARIPRVQEKLQLEMEQIVGSSRPPNYQEDSKNLVYLNAFLKELFRFRTPSFLGIPHASTEDDVYEQYVIPQNTLIILNSHAIHFDPERFASPEKFLPERFLNKEGDESKILEDWDHHAFGAGRRICAGSHFADQQVWVAVAGIIWAFNVVECSKTPVGDLLRDEDMTRGLANYPLEYKVRFIPKRSQNIFNFIFTQTM